MRRSHRFLGFGLITTAAFLAGGAPLWATDFANIDSANADGLSTADTINFTDIITNDPTHVPTPTLDPTDSTLKSLIIGATGTSDTTFSKGVNLAGDAGLNIQFNGSVTFKPSDPADPTIINVLDIGQLSFNGSNDPANPAELSIEDTTLDLGASEVTIDGNYKIKFIGADAGLKNPIEILSLGVTAAATLSFGEKTAITTKALEIGPGGATIASAVHVGTAATALTEGLTVTDSLTVNGPATLDRPLSGGGAGFNFIFNTPDSILLGTQAAGSGLEWDTKFKIGPDSPIVSTALNENVVTFRPFAPANSSPGAVEAFKAVAKSLEVDDSDIAALFPMSTTSEIAYDKDNGYAVVGYYSTEEAMKGVPEHGAPFVQALDTAETTDGTNLYQPHKALAVAIKGAAKRADVSADLNTIMGNAPNAALVAALSGNMNRVMGHLNSTLSTTMPGFAGPSGVRQGLWLAPAYSMTDIGGSPKDGYGDLEITNPSVTLGYERSVNERLRLGVFAAVGRPESEGDTETINTDTLEVGLYGQARLNYGLTVNAGLAYGTQNHDAERKIPPNILNGLAPFAAQTIKSSFDGDTLSAALEVSRLYPLGQNTFIRPTVGYNYISTSVDGFSEKSNSAAPGDNLGHKAEATDFTLHLVRLGAEGGWSNDLTTVTGRLFWVGNMGDTQPKTRAALITDGSVPFTLVGAEYDKNMVNIGLGLKYAPPQTRGLTFGLNYDALLGSNAKSHNLSLMMRYEF